MAQFCNFKSLKTNGAVLPLSPILSAMSDGQEDPNQRVLWRRNKQTNLNSDAPHMPSWRSDPITNVSIHKWLDVSILLLEAFK